MGIFLYFVNASYKAISIAALAAGAFLKSLFKESIIDSNELISLFNNNSFEVFFKREIEFLMFSPVTNSAGEPAPIPQVPSSSSILIKIFSTKSMAFP